MKKLSLDLRPLLKYRLVFYWLLLLGLFGYTLFKVNSIAQPTPDPAYLKQQETTKLNEIKIDEHLRSELEKLVKTNVDTEPSKLGRPDPFNP